MENLLKHIQNYVRLSEKDIGFISETVPTIRADKQEILLREGEICRFSYFVSSGCLRMYFIKDNGAEQITQFAIENWWISDYMSSMTRTPSQFYIQAVEPSEVVLMDTRVTDVLFREVPQLERYFRIVNQRAYAAMQFRIKYLYGFSGEELYLHFTSRFPEFVQRVPQYMLASYLGLSAEYLSKLRKKNAREGIS